MNDRNRWGPSRGDTGRDDNRYRQGGDPSRQPSQQYERGGQQGGWHDDDDHGRGGRSGDWRGSEWRGNRDWGEPRYSQPQQREWRGAGRMENGRLESGGDSGYAERAWGGSSGQMGGGAPDHDREHERPMTERREWRQQGPGDPGAIYNRAWQDDDLARHREQRWGRHDDFRAGSQGFAGAYGMGDGPNYDQRGRSGGSANPTFGRGYGPDYGRDEHQGFFERVASWFGGDHDDDRDREGRRQSHRGRGPADYTRSDERIREDVNDRLTDDHFLDASRISVSVEKGEVTLNGVVPSREAKRRAEDVVDHLSGVKHVQNNLRIDQDSFRNRMGGGEHTGSGWAGTTGGMGQSGNTGATSGGAAGGSGASTGNAGSMATGAGNASGTGAVNASGTGTGNASGSGTGNASGTGRTS